MGLSIIPPREPYAGKAFQSGVGTYLNQMEKNRTYGLQEQKMEQQQTQFDVSHDLDLTRLDYTKKRDLGNFMSDAVKQMSKEDAEKYLEEPDVIKTFEDLDWPLPHGVYKEEEEVTLADFKKDIAAKWRADPNSVTEEEKHFAGIRIAPKTIPYAEVQDAKKAIPIWDKVFLGKQASEKRYERIKSAYEAQRGIGSWGSAAIADPLGAR